MLPTDALEYDLPERLVATSPAATRDDARMFVVSRSDQSLRAHERVRDLPEYLRAKDVLVVNDTRVLPARLVGRRTDTGGRVEGLFLREERDGGWRALLRSNGRLRVGARIALGETNTEFTLRERDGDEWIIAAAQAGPARALLERIGATPLPPYILRARRARDEPEEAGDDRARYQTVYARDGASAQPEGPQLQGSVAAPTAGLHLTRELLGAITARGVARASVSLDVGVGTFKPIETTYVEEHPIHGEWMRVPAATVSALATAAREGGRRVCVGTTSVRTVESLPPDASGDFTGETRLLIAPGHAWRRTDALLTNFHLPRSSLLALVAALLDGGAPRLLDLYREAIAEKYRFFSYGDAMLILP